MSRRSSGQARLVSLAWTERAVADLERIGDYIAADNPSAAAEWVDQLVTAAGRTVDAPFSGRRVPEIGSDDIREVLKDNYRIVYRLRGSLAEVLTVFEGHRLFPADVARRQG